MRLTFWEGTFTVFQAVEKILIVVGVPIAAYWTWFTFSTTDTEKARISYEVKLARAKNLGLQIQVKCSTYVSGKKEYVTGGVDIFNMGAGLVRIDVSGPDVMIASRLEFSRDGLPTLGRRLTMPFLTDMSRPKLAQAFVPQRRRFLPFSFVPAVPGVYFIRFNAPVSFTKDDDTLTDPRLWGAATTVVVNGQNGNMCGSSPPT